MKITMDFDFPDDDHLFEMAINGSKYYNIIDDILDHLRRNLKYADLPEGTYKVYEEINGLIYDLIREYGTSIP